MDEYITTKSGAFEPVNPVEFVNIPRIDIVDMRENEMVRYTKLHIISEIPRFWKYLMPQKLWFKDIVAVLEYVFITYSREFFVHICRVAGFWHARVLVLDVNPFLKTARYHFELKRPADFYSGATLEIRGEMAVHGKKLQEFGFVQNLTHGYYHLSFRCQK